jgi:hypothetical protein
MSNKVTRYKGRGVVQGQRVKVYRNLHRGGYSVVALDGHNKGLVVAHAGRVVLTDVVFAVSEAGRRRVWREKKKNVHAYAMGRWSRAGGYASMVIAHKQHPQVFYSPYRNDTFHTLEGGGLQAVNRAKVLYLGDDGCFGVGLRWFTSSTTMGDCDGLLRRMVETLRSEREQQRGQDLPGDNL